MPCNTGGGCHPPPEDLPNPGIAHGFPALQADTLPSQPPGKGKPTVKQPLSFRPPLLHLGSPDPLSTREGPHPPHQGPPLEGLGASLPWDWSEHWSSASNPNLATSGYTALERGSRSELLFPHLSQKNTYPVQDTCSVSRFNTALAHLWPAVPLMAPVPWPCLLPPLTCHPPPSFQTSSC